MILMVVNVQEENIIPQLWRYDLFFTNIRKLIEVARERKVEVIYVGKEKNERSDIHKELILDNKKNIFELYDDNAFMNVDLVDYLSTINESKIMIVGLYTDTYIDATIKGGFEIHMEMIVPEFCNSTDGNKYMSGEETYYYYNKKMWKNRYAKCISLNEAIECLK